MIKKTHLPKVSDRLRSLFQINKFRRDVLLNTWANGIYNLIFFMIPIMIVRFSTYNDAGIWALSSAFSANLLLAAMTCTITAYVTDSERRFSDGTFFMLRIFTTCGSLFLLLPMVFILDFSPAARICSAVLLFYKAGESVCVLLYGALILRRRYDLIAVSSTIKSILGFAAFVAGLLFFNLFFAVIFFTVVYYIVSFFYDYQFACGKIDWNGIVKKEDFLVILKKSLPVLINAFFLPVQLFFTRYVINLYYTDNELGGYFSVTQFMQLFPIILNPLLAILLPELSALKNRMRYHALFIAIIKAALCVVVSASALCVLTHLFGSKVLVLIFDEEILPYAYLLFITIVISCFLIFFQFLGTLIMSFQENNILTFSCLLGLAVCFLSTKPCILRWGLIGSCYSMLAAFAVQIICFVIFLAVRYREALRTVLKETVSNDSE